MPTRGTVLLTLAGSHPVRMRVGSMDMKQVTIISLVVGVAIGIAADRIWETKTAIPRHWKAVRSFNAHMRNPANYKPTGNGFTAASLPFDPSPDLGALVAAGELKHSDIVLPMLVYPNREATRYWMTFCERYSNEIVYAEGAAEPGPFHLNIWYTAAGEPLIKQLVEDLKTMGSRTEPATGGTVSR